MIKLKKVDGKNIWEILRLKVEKEQEGFIASNEISIIQTYIVEKSGGVALPFGIYNDELLIGFVLIGFGKDEYCSEGLDIAVDNYNLWRFMIAKEYQKKGYGKQALEVIIDYIKTFPCGEAKYCWLSYEEDNLVAKKLYKKFGFVETDYRDDEEIVSILEL